MAIEATELYGEPALPAIYKKYDATIGGTNVGATLAGDMLNKLRSGAVAWEEKLFPGMKGAMPATLPEEAMRLLTAYPRRYLSKDIAHVEAAGAFGATFSGIHLPVQYGKGPASAMLNMPRGVIHAVERFTGETLPSFMGEGLAKEWQGALYGMRFPVYYPQRRVRTTAGVAAPSLISSFDVLAEELRAGGFGRRTTRDVAMGVFGRMGALETQPYTGVYRGYLGEMEIAKPGGGYASLVDVMQERKDEEYARLTKQFGGKIPRAGLIHGYESATAKAIVGATWEHQVFTDFGKVSGLLERGIVSTEALNYLLPFGAAADTARQMYQVTRMGKIVNEIAEKAIPASMRLAHAVGRRPSPAALHNHSGDRVGGGCAEVCRRCVVWYLRRGCHGVATSWY
jgi:hypothetical protein